MVKMIMGLSKNKVLSLLPVTARDRRSFVPAARNHLSDFTSAPLSGQTINKIQSICENTSRLSVFIPRTIATPVGMNSLLYRITSVAPLNKPQTMF